MKRIDLRIFCMALALLTCLPATADENKPDLQLSEVVIRASSPVLSGGSKEQVPMLEHRVSSEMVSGTVNRLSMDFPEVLEILDKPRLEKPTGCLAPVLTSPLGAMWGTKGRMAKAARAWNNGNWQAVIDALMPVIDSADDPEIPRAMYFVGRSRRNLGDLPGTANMFDQLRKRYPKHPLAEYAEYSLGWIYLESRNLERSVEIIDDFRKKYPNSRLTPYARYLKASTLYLEKKYDDALETLEGIVAGYPLFPYKPQVQFWIAENLYFHGDITKSLQNFTLFIQNYPSNEHLADALYGRAFCNLDLGKIPDALADFDTLITRFPDNPLSADAAFQAGKTAVIAGDNDTALRFLKMAVRTGGTDPARQAESNAWITYQNREYREASRLFRSASDAMKSVADDPKQTMRKDELRFLSALSLFLAGDRTDSVDAFESLADHASSSEIRSSSLGNAGIVWMKLGKPAKAYDRLSRALQMKEHLKNAVIFELYAAESLYRLQRYEESLARFRLLTGPSVSSPIQIEAYRGIAWDLYAMKKWKEAAAAFDLLATRYPDAETHPEALLREAESWFNAKDYDRARSMFAALISEYPLHPEAFEARLLKARIEWVTGDYAAGKDALEETMKYAVTGADRQRVRLLMGDLEQAQSHFEAAAERYNEAFLDDPRGPGAAHALMKQANNFYNLKHYQDAEDVYRKIIDLFPGSTEASSAQYSIGLTYFQRGRLNDYLDECRHVAAKHPGTRQSSLALWGAAEILVEQNRLDEAIVLFRKLLDEYKPFIDEQLTCFRLAQALEQNGQITQAITQYHSLLEMAPMGLYAADAALALARYEERAGNLKDAEERYAYIIQHFPTHPRYAETLLAAARTARAADKPSQAIKYLDMLTGMNSPLVHEAELLKAELYLDENHFADARSVLDKAVTAPDRNLVARAQLLIGVTMEKQNRRNDALKHYLKIAYLYPDQSHVKFKALIHAADILAAQGNAAGARKMLMKARAAATTADEKRIAGEKPAEPDEAGGRQ